MVLGDFSTREVATLCGLTERRIRALVHAGVVGAPLPPSAARAKRARTRPHTSGAEAARRHRLGRLRYTFGDVRVLRMAASLLRQGVAGPRLQRTLTDLSVHAKRSAQPLSGAQIACRDGQLLATQGERTWDAETGQALLWTAQLGVPAEARARLTGTAQAAEAPGTQLQFAQMLPHHGARERAAEHHGRGLRAEAGCPRAAYEHHMQALACDPLHVEAMLSLGQLCAADRDLPRAQAYFRLATRVDPAHPVAQYNLAATLQEQGEIDGAIRAYNQALRLDPGCAEAHYNLGMLLRQRGETEAAARHLSAYLTHAER